MSRDNSRRTFLKTLGGTGIIAASAGCQGILGQESGEYPSEPIEFETPNDPGGGSDVYLRSLAEHLSSNLGVDVTPLNETPAEQTVPELHTSGGDGYNIMTANPAQHLWQMNENGRDTPFNFANWQSLGAPNRAALIIVASTDSGVESWDELVQRSEEGETFVGGGIGAGIQIYYDLISQNTPVNIEYAGGFDGTGPIMTEMERGNIDLYHAPTASLHGYVDDGIITPIITNSDEIVGEYMLEQYGNIGHEGIADTSYEDLGLSDLATLSQNTRACIASPEVESDRIETLRTAFSEVMSSDEFEEDLAEQNYPVNALSGEELQAILEEKADIAINYYES